MIMIIMIIMFMRCFGLARSHRNRLSISIRVTVRDLWHEILCVNREYIYACACVKATRSMPRTYGIQIIHTISKFRNSIEFEKLFFVSDTSAWRCRLSGSDQLALPPVRYSSVRIAPRSGGSSTGAT